MRLAFVKTRLRRLTRIRSLAALSCVSCFSATSVHPWARSFANSGESNGTVRDILIDSSCVFLRLDRFPQFPEYHDFS